MKKTMCILLAVMLSCACLFGAMAETLPLTLTGTVVSGGSRTVLTPIGGTAETVEVRAGERVSAGDTLLTVETNKIRASQNGVVSLFGEVGDDGDTVTERYGAVAYMEPDYQYSISASTRKAYDATENYYIHPGEKVYLRCYSDGKHVGEGVVTAVSGTNYTVEILSGAFEYGETISIFRDSAYATASRIGRGTIARMDPVAYTDSGVIVKYCVENGAQVQKGDVLFETVTATFDGQTTNNQVLADQSGVVAAVNVVPGDALTEGGAVLTLYPDEAMRIEAYVSESDLAGIQIGSEVTVEFIYLDAAAGSINGTVEAISLIPEENAEEEEDDEVSYAVTILPASTENLRYGMNVTVTTVTE